MSVGGAWREGLRSQLYLGSKEDVEELIMIVGESKGKAGWMDGLSCLLYKQYVGLLGHKARGKNNNGRTINDNTPPPTQRSRSYLLPSLLHAFLDVIEGRACVVWL